MTLELLKRSEKGSAINSEEYDATMTAIETEVNGKVANTEKGAAEGVATLDSDGLVPVAQINDTALLASSAREIGGTAYKSLLGIVGAPSLEFKAWDYKNEANGAPSIATFARASTATYFDAAGVMQTASADELRHGYDPLTGEYKGWLIEESRTRLNTIAAAPAAAEDITVAATEHTISFYGSGSIALSGAYSGSLIGTGDERVELTFTPSVGTLVCTPSGAVENLQVEVGSSATSVIVGSEGSQATRAADVLSVDVDDFAYNQNAGTLLVEVNGLQLSGSLSFATFSDDSTANYILVRSASSDGVLVTSGVSQASLNLGGNSSEVTAALSWVVDDVAGLFCGGSLFTDSSCVVPSVTTLYIGSFNGIANWCNGNIGRILYFPRRLTNEQLQLLTS